MVIRLRKIFCLKLRSTFKAPVPGHSIRDNVLLVQNLVRSLNLRMDLWLVKLDADKPHTKIARNLFKLA